MNKLSLSLIVSAFVLVGCGGGGSSAASSAPAAAPTQSACAAPAQKDWIHSHLDDVYLWYNQIVDVTADNYAVPADYFYALLVKSEDHPWYATDPDATFSFTASQAEMDAFFQSASSVGYGTNFVADPIPAQPDHSYIRVSYSEPGSPAAQQNMVRGAIINKINGTDISQVTSANLRSALYPTQAGQSNTFEIIDAGATSPRSVTLTAAAVTSSPVLTSSIINTNDGKKVGYIVFNDHIAPAEQALKTAIQNFKTVGIDDLVLDVRYNGGGLIYIASELASMISGSATNGQTFEKFQYNDKHSEKTNSANSTMPFYSTDSDDSPLPQLGLTRVFVLTSQSTCSASESIINGLSPFIQVFTFGSTTCGKPYGMVQTNNCEQAYFAIQFRGVNANGDGNYENGIAPTCAAKDDLDHPLGNSNESMLASALSYRTDGTCPVTSFTQSRSAHYAPPSTKQVYRAPWRENRILR